MKGARGIALSSLLKVPGRGFVEEILDRFLAKSDLSPVDRRLARELTLGTVRMRGTIDAVAKVFSKKPLKKLDRFVHEVVRLGLYQLLFCDRIPVHAAVHETVQLVKKSPHRRASGYVNAMLRRISDSLKRGGGGVSADPRFGFSRFDGTDLFFDRAVFPNPETDLAGYLAAIHSHPRFLVDRWLSRHGRERTEVFLLAGNRRPALSLRQVSGRVDPERFRQAFESQGLSLTPGPEAGIWLVAKGGDPRGYPGYQEGWFVVQDPTQAQVVPAANVLPGQRILELCAAPGGKTAHLAEIAGGEGIVAVDRDWKRTLKITSGLKRLGFSGVIVLCADVCSLPLREEEAFDRILLDVPCSNTGVLARRAEARWRFHGESLRTLIETQRKLLRVALTRLAPGGVLTYSTCSLEEEENEGVVRSVVAETPGFRFLQGVMSWPETGWGGGGFWQIEHSG